MKIHRPRIAATVPDGWVLSECLELAHPSHAIHLSARLLAIPDGHGLTEVADDRQRVLEQQLPGYREENLEPAVVFGVYEGLTRRGSWQPPDGERMELLETYWAGSQEACLITCSWPADEDAGAALAEEMVSGLRLLRTLGGGPPAISTAAEASASRIYRSFEDGELEGALAAVARSATPEAATGSTIFTGEELTVLGHLLGLDGFPGVGADVAAAASRTPDWGPVFRSLLARGALRLDEGGDLSFGDEEVGRVLATCAEPDVVVTATRQRGAEGETRLSYATRELAVEQRLVEDGIYELAAYAPLDLTTRLVAFCELENGPEPQAQAFSVEAATFVKMEQAARSNPSDISIADLPEEAAAFVTALADPSSSALRLRIVRRDHARVVGGELTWVDGGKAGRWLVETEPAADGQEDDGSVRVEAASAGALLATISDLLADA